MWMLGPTLRGFDLISVDGGSSYRFQCAVTVEILWVKSLLTWRSPQRDVNMSTLSAALY